MAPADEPECDRHAALPQVMISLGRRAEGLKLSLSINDAALNELRHGGGLSLHADNGLVYGGDVDPVDGEIAKVEINSGL